MVSDIYIIAPLDISKTIENWTFPENTNVEFALELDFKKDITQQVIIVFANKNSQIEKWVTKAKFKKHPEPIVILVYKLDNQNDFELLELPVFDEIWVWPVPEEIFIAKLKCSLYLFNKNIELSRRNLYLNNQKQLFLRQKAKLENIMKSLPMGIIFADTKGNIKVMNRRAKKIIGLSIDDDVLTSSFLREKISYYPFDLVRGMKDKNGVVIEEKLKLPSGEYLSEIALVKDYSKEVLGTLIVFHEIKEKDNFREKAIELIDSVLHEIRTPITTVVTGLELLSNDLADKLDKRNARILTLCHSNSNRLIDIATDFLDVSKIESGYLEMSMENVELSNLIRETIEAFEISAQEKKVTFSVQISHKYDLILADVSRLRQVFNNLLSNAIKFSPDGSEIHVKTEGKVLENKQYIQVSVQNFGPIIPGKEQIHLFDRFFRAAHSRKPDKIGSGLGLHIVKLIINAMGGEIWTISKKEKGTTFFFTLPAIQNNL